jgi:hypothetical protein
MKHDDWSRSLIRKIALGLPIVLPVITAPFSMGLGCYPLGYRCPERIEMVQVDYAPATDGSAQIDCNAACGGEDRRCELISPGRVECVQTIVECPGAGRRPDAALAASECLSSDPIVKWLRDATILEAASVPAFDALARDLEALGAPEELARAARLAMDDELAHARSMARLTAAYGGPLAIRVEVGRPARRSLAELALHNAVEGCVREAHGAIEAASRALHAEDPYVRTAFAEIAPDEARHALLSFAIDDWARPLLSDQERREIDDAVRRERAALG